MKKLVLVFAFLAVFAAGLAAQSHEVTVEVDGLACPFCVYALDKKFQQVKGVKNLEIDFKKGEMTFTLDDGIILTEKEIKKKVKDAGYTARTVKFEIVNDNHQ